MTGQLHPTIVPSTQGLSRLQLSWSDRRTSSLSLHSVRRPVASTATALGQGKGYLEFS